MLRLKRKNKTTVIFKTGSFDDMDERSELDRFLIEFKFECKRHLHVRVQRFLFFEFKFEFGKNDQVRVHNPIQLIP